jgi:hypothetical protein
MEQIVKTKVCYKCKIDKDTSLFAKNKTAKDGLQALCKPCSKLYREENKQYYSEYGKKYRTENKDYFAEYGKNYRVENKEYFQEYSKEYREENKDYFQSYGKEWRKENREYLNKYMKDRKDQDILFRLRCDFSSSICNSLKKIGTSKRNRGWETLLGYSRHQLKEHLEKLFEPWMNWDNHGRYKIGGERRWHIDHIIPLSSATTEEEMLHLWRLENLRPLEATENISKGKKILVEQVSGGLDGTEC